MVKVDMLYQLDFRLQEITQRDIPFGGISLFVFGDLMQLRPVLGRFIFDDPILSDYEETHLCNPRWKMFGCTILEKNHRQGRDKSYADLLNRIRTGNHTEEDMEVLETRIRKKGHEDLETADLFLGGKRRQCAKLNEDYIFKQMKDSGKLFKIKSVNFSSTNKHFQPRVDEKDGTVGSTSFQDVLFLRIGAKIMIIHKVDTLDSITNGQLGTLGNFFCFNLMNYF